jgi:hypothetical protein
MPQLQVLSSFPDVSGYKMSPAIVNESLSILLLFYAGLDELVKFWVLLTPARFAFADLIVGDLRHDLVSHSVVSCTVTDHPARPGLAKKSVEIQLDDGSIRIDFAEVVCMKSVSTPPSS